MQSLQQTPPTTTHTAGAESPNHPMPQALPHQPANQLPLPSPQILKAMSLAFPGLRAYRPPQGALLPPQAAEKVPKSLRGIGRGSAEEEQSGCCARGRTCIGRARERIRLTGQWRDEDQTRCLRKYRRWEPFQGSPRERVA